MNDFDVRSVHTNVDYSRHYDLNVLALFHYDNQHKHRLPWFRSLGLINQGNRAVHVTAVCSLGDGDAAAEIAKGWAKRTDITVLEMRSLSPVTKINGSYLWLREHRISSQWVLRVHDDSVTDVDRLLTQQEFRFGQAAVHVMNSPAAVPAEGSTDNLIEKYLKARNLSQYSTESEFEAGLTSKAALKQIFDSNAACDFLRYAACRSEIQGDKCVAFAARIAGIPTIQATGMTHQFAPDALSVVGGPMTHIHYVDWRDERFTQMLWAFQYGTQSTIDTELLATIEDRALEFGRCVGVPIAVLRFAKNGRIQSKFYVDEIGWVIFGSSLWLLDRSGAPTAIFDGLLTGEGGRRWLVGFQASDDVRHYLGPLFENEPMSV